MTLFVVFLVGLLLVVLAVAVDGISLDAVNLNNVRTEQFPDMLLAPMAGLTRAPLFVATPEQAADIDVGGRLRA
jgi:hypothetical protein